MVLCPNVREHSLEMQVETRCFLVIVWPLFCSAQPAVGKGSRPGPSPAEHSGALRLRTSRA